MDAKTQARLGARARIIKAMAHPTRLFIVETLSGGERCVSEGGRAECRHLTVTGGGAARPDGRAEPDGPTRGLSPCGRLPRRPVNARSLGSRIPKEFV
jgi:hypothetical protein